VAKSDLVSILKETFDDPPEPTPEELSEEARQMSEWGRTKAKKRWNKSEMR
jgi:hypothetical protein